MPPKYIRFEMDKTKGDGGEYLDTCRGVEINEKQNQN
jgi:hypothetical protein